MIIIDFPEHSDPSYYSSGFYAGLQPKTIGIAGRFDSPQAMTLRVASGWINIRYTFSMKYSTAEIEDPNFELPEGESVYADWPEDKVNAELFPILAGRLALCFDTVLINRLLNCIYLEPDDQLVSYLANRSILGAAKAVTAVENLIARKIESDGYLDASTVQPQIIGGQIDPIILQGGSNIDTVIDRLIHEVIEVNLKEENETLAKDMQLQIRVVKWSFLASQYIEVDPNPDSNGFEPESGNSADETADDLKIVRYAVAFNQFMEYIGVYEVPIGSFVVNYVQEGEPDVMENPDTLLPVQYRITVESEDKTVSYITRLSTGTTLKDVREAIEAASRATDEEGSAEGDNTDGTDTSAGGDTETASE